MKGLLSLFLYCSYVTVLVAAIAITKPGVNRHIIMPKTKPKARTTKVRKSHSNDCVAFREYNQLKDMEDQNAVSALRLSQSNTNAQQSGESISSPSDSNYTCSNYNTCLEAHLHNLHQFGLKQRCAIAQSIPNMQDRKITFTHIPKAGGSGVHTALGSTEELRRRSSAYADPHLPFYSQQSMNPEDFYFTLFRNPANLFISFFNYVAQRSTLPPHAKCNIGWEAAFENKKTPFRFAKRHHDVTEGDFLHYFVPRVPNASPVLRAWPAYKAMQLLPPDEQVIRHPWLPHFPREEYLRYLHGGNSDTDAGKQNEDELMSVFPKQYECRPYVEASILLLTRYAAVGTLENISDMYTVLLHRAQIRDHGSLNISKVVHNRSFKVMSPGVEEAVKVLLKENLFCQTLMWKMAAAINTVDLQCISDE